MGIYEQGLAGLCVAGSEATQNILGKGSVGLNLVLPSTVMEQINQTDAAFQSLDADVKAHVTRPAFLQGWQATLNAWNTFKSNNDTQFKIAKNFPSTVLAEVQQHKEKLNGWRDAYAKETNISPSGPQQNIPKPPPPEKEPERMSEGTKLLIGLFAVLAIGGFGYATYRYFQTAKRQTVKGKRFLEGELSRGLTPETRAMKVALED
jgi:hypothetical protein